MFVALEGQKAPDTQELELHMVVSHVYMLHMGAGELNPGALQWQMLLRLSHLCSPLKTFVFENI